MPASKMHTWIPQNEAASEPGTQHAQDEGIGRGMSGAQSTSTLPDTPSTRPAAHHTQNIPFNTPFRRGFCPKLSCEAPELQSAEFCLTSVVRRRTTGQTRSYI